MKISRPSPSMVIAGIALFVSLGGTSMAAVSYATRAGSVDGKSAVFAGASLSQAAGKLVATNRSGTDKGRLPGKFVADVPKTQTFSRSFEVADNAPGAPQAVASMSGLGTLTATCNDQNNAAGNEDPISTITFLNQSGVPVNLARRVGNGDGALGVVANQTATSVAIGGSNTFVFHVELSGRNSIITGGVRQDGRGTATASCGVFGVVEEILP
ncbi:hypothetical protein OM076_42375 [Solirubrobacter ginsenosidimutans]|uniref:Uncharacterized protein n=1 Tax=Solirubrobacter ginsenosidimutans TaxID=490573 RepID=A0A9X3N4K7_9ACTN|nr:hypothetical protein [Solirubrobacter ginsenosidimutans]MDA0166983.1 hypothetical protein [Solirubrobacter ginsenosidimutans]